ncbi:glycosyltransferase [Glaciimonas sp. GG7]
MYASTAGHSLALPGTSQVPKANLLATIHALSDKAEVAAMSTPPSQATHSSKNMSVVPDAKPIRLLMPVTVNTKKPPKQTLRANWPVTPIQMDSISPFSMVQDAPAFGTSVGTSFGTSAVEFPVKTIPGGKLMMLLLQWLGAVIAVFLVIYTCRHVIFTLNRLFGVQRHPYSDIDVANWPSVTVLIAAHNEEAVISGSLRALLEVDFPAGKLDIVPVNDRSTDRTREIIDRFVAQHPDRIHPFHRVDGKPGKAAALKDATAAVTSDIIIVFDADYIPSKGLIKQLVSAFFDPEVGAVMGRVVPLNVGTNLLTRLLDLERSAGYQVDQQARMNLRLVPQYGGTVGGVRMRALHSIGGWHDDVLAEDTDLTFRLLLRGWKTVYQNRCECYEEVPESWPVRYRQIKRWAKGHNQALFRHSKALLRDRSVPVMERIDGLLLLGVYAMSPMVILGWVIGILAFYFGDTPLAIGLLSVVAFTSYCTLGNFAAFFEIAAGVHLDYNHRRIRLLPFNLIGFIVSLVGISEATLEQLLTDHLMHRRFQWDKTVRYRKEV